MFALVFRSMKLNPRRWVVVRTRRRSMSRWNECWHFRIFFWFNPLALATVILAYVMVFRQFGWSNFDIPDHTMGFIGLIIHFLVSYLSLTIDCTADQLSEMTASFGYVLIRDGMFILGALAGVYCLRFKLVFRIERQAHGPAFQTNDLAWLYAPRRSRKRRRRWRPRALRPFRCVLSRSLVFRYNFARARRPDRQRLRSFRGMRASFD